MKHLATYLHSDEFFDKCRDFDRRLDAGEIMTCQAAADLVGLPCSVFREIFAGYLAWLHATEHRETLH